MPSGLKGKVNEGDLLCKKCYGTKATTLPHSILKEKITNDEAGTSTASNMDQQSPPKKIKLDIPAAQSSSVKCIVCQKSRRTSSSANLTKLSPKQRAKIFIKIGAIVTEGARACVSHVNGNALKDDCYNKLLLFQI